jgi:hypothetical protein
MEAAGIDMQIVSLTAPGVEQLEAAEAVALAVETNDFVAETPREDRRHSKHRRCYPRESRSLRARRRRAGLLWFRPWIRNCEGER